jgi:MFS family permease
MYSCVSRDALGRTVRPGYSFTCVSTRFVALTHPSFRYYLAGGFLSNVGNQVQTWAIVWHVYSLTESSFMVGVIGLVRVAPLLLFSLFGGVIADQFDRRKVMLLTQSALMVIAVVLAILTLSDRDTVGAIYALVAVSAVARAFDGPSRQALVASLVPANHLPNAISLNGVSWRLSDVIGPIIAGFLIAWNVPGPVSGLALCYVVNFVSFFAVLYAVWKLPPRLPDMPGLERVRSLGQVVDFIKDGLRFVHRTPVVRNAMWIDFWATFFSAADALLPAFAGPILELGPKGFGILAASTGVGALLAAVVMTWLPPVRHQGRWVIIMIAAYGVCTVLFGLSQNLAMAVIFLAGTGAADMVSTVLRQTIRQLATPDHMRGRMSATGMLFHISGPQLGDFEAGLVSKFTGERLSVVLGGLACMVIAGIWGKGSALRDYEHRPTETTMS